MNPQAYQGIAMVVYFAAMIGIGFWAYRRTKNFDDYMLAGRDLGPFATALSAGAADMSGWLLMGLPGALYAHGMVELWIAIGLTIGAWLNWKFVARGFAPTPRWPAIPSPSRASSATDSTTRDTCCG